MSLTTIAPACACPKCAALCRNSPGWPTPEEADRLLDLGYGKRTMLDWWEADPPVYIVCPASRGSEGDLAPTPSSMFGYLLGWTKGECNLFADGKCEIHDSGAKPLQCREAFGCSKRDGFDGEADNDRVMKMWDTDAGRAVVARWRAETGVDDDRSENFVSFLGD